MLPDPVVQRGVGEDGDPGQHVGVAAQVLGGRVDHDVRPVLDRAAEQWGGEGVVHHAQHPGLAGDADQGRQVGDPRRRVGDRLQVQQPGGGPQGGADFLRVVAPDVGDRHAPARGQVGQGREGAAVQALLGDHVVPGAEQREQHGVDRAHPGGGRQRAAAALQPGHRVLQRTDRRIAQPVVEEGPVGPREGLRQRVAVGEREDVALMDRHAQRPASGHLRHGRVDDPALGPQPVVEVAHPPILTGSAATGPGPIRSGWPWIPGRRGARCPSVPPHPCRGGTDGSRGTGRRGSARAPDQTRRLDRNRRPRRSRTGAAISGPGPVCAAGPLTATPGRRGSAGAAGRSGPGPRRPR